jgi:hypothetical protein
LNTQPDNQDAEPERYIRFQFWLSDHGEPILFNHWSDGQFEEADLMLPERIVDQSDENRNLAGIGCFQAKDNAPVRQDLSNDARLGDRVGCSRM